MSRNTLHPAALAALIAVALVAPVVHGHETIPPDLCTSAASRPVVASRFELNAERLAQLGGARIENPNLCDRPGTCGIVDHWHFTRKAAGRYCALWSDNPGLTPDTFAMMTAPASYLGDRHHEEYALVEGAEGICVVCILDADDPR